MLEARSYQLVYLAIVIILTIFYSIKYSGYSDARIENTQPSKASTFGLILSVFMSIFIGLRPLSVVFVDMINYNSFYYVLYYGKPFEFDWSLDNFIFDNLFEWLASNSYEIVVFFVICSIIYFMGAYMACKKMFPRDTVYAYITFLAAFSTFSYATNGLKSGAAASLFLCALAYRDKKYLCALFLFLALGFHHSMLLPVGAFIVALFLKKPKYYLIIWLACLVISIAHITFFQTYLAGYSGGQGAHYLNSIDSDWGSKTGFRIDFVLYSALPIIIGWYAIFRRKMEVESYNFIFNVYTLSNAIWMLCMYAAFTNRIAYLSWLMYPIVLVAPFLSKKFMPRQYAAMNVVVWVQLLFTLFMYIH